MGAKERKNMKPFCIASIGAILGILIGLYLSSIVLFSVFGFCILLIIRWKQKKKLSFLIIFIICFIAFSSYTILLEKQYNKQAKEYEGQEVKIEGIVVSNPKQTEYKDSYTIKVTQIENITTKAQEKKSFQLLCNMKRGKNDSIQLQYGDKIECMANYEIPSSARNEGGFDYRQYLKTKKIVGIVTIKQEGITKIAENQGNWLMTKIQFLKNKLIDKIKTTLPEQTAGICIGLLLGDKSDISEEIQNNFKQSSLSHMLAISGAHVSYLLLGITTFLDKLKIHKRWSKIIVILFLLFFMALVEFTPSVTRACIMCILSLMADILFQKSDVYHNLAISTFFILLFNPYAILDIGFQLSFGGTIGIILFMKQNQNKKEIIKNVSQHSSKEEIEQSNEKCNKFMQNSKLLKIIKKEHINDKQEENKIVSNIKQIIQVSFSANLVIFPIMIYHFNTISATFLISNILASPVLGISLIVGMIFVIFLIIIPPMAQILSYFLNPILQILIQITNITSKLPLSKVLVPTPKIWQIGIYYFLLFLFFKPQKLKNKKSALTSVTDCFVIARIKET